MYKCGYLSGAVWIGPGAKTVLPCCYTAGKVVQTDSHKHIDVNSINDVINHPMLLKTREQALDNAVPTLCLSCDHYERNNIRSARQRSLDHFKNNGIVKRTVDETDIEHLFLSLSNVCNYKCIICSEKSSHLIAKEKQLSSPLKDVSNNLFDQVIDLISSAQNLRTLQMTGGEPFYNKKRLERVIDACHKNMHVYFHTNGSIFDSEAERITKKLEQFDSACVMFSIDGYEGYFEYQRVNGVWDDVLDNLIRFNKVIDTDKVKSELCYTASCFNLLIIPEFITRYRQYFSRMVFNDLYSPVEFNLELVDKKHLMKFLDEMDNIDLTDIEISGLLLRVEKALSQPVDNKLVTRLWKQVDRLKTVRGIDLDEKIPNARDFLYHP